MDVIPIHNLRCIVMAMSAEAKERFKQRMLEQVHGSIKKVEKEVKKEEIKKEEVVCGEHQQLFSTLFFDPAEINLPDFAVNTYHHLHPTFPEWVRECIPTQDPLYQWNKQITYSFVASDDEHAFLVGLPGSGKTTLPIQVAAVIGRPVFKQSFSQDLEADEWIMSKEIDETGTHWKTLPFIRSLAYPFYTVLDEFNRLRRGGRLLMNRLLEEGGSMQLRDGSEVVPHPEWRAIATDNTRGMGDGLDVFDGDVADISTTDRFGIMLEVGYLPHSQQVSLLLSWEDIPPDVASSIVSFGTLVVGGFKSGSLPLPWTPRRMKKAAKLTKRYGNPVHALRDCYYNFLAEDDERGVASQYLRDCGLSSYGDFK